MKMGARGLFNASCQVFPDNSGQLEHRDLWLAEHGQQFVAGVDVALVDGALQIVGLDLVPRFLHDLGVTSLPGQHVLQQLDRQVKARNDAVEVGPFI